MKKRHLILFAVCLCAGVARAYELREWEDVHGHRFTGRFVRELFGKLTVEDEDGNPETLAIEDLSDVDKKYIRVMIPPKIEVEIRTKSRRLEKRPASNTQDDIEEVYSVTAHITKRSQRPFTSRLNIEAFIVGEEVEGENYILLGRVEDSFLLLEEKDYQYTFESKPFLTTQFTDSCSQARKGELYEGHILIITSMEGEQILLDSNLPKWMQQPELLDKLRELSVRGAPSIRSRHFNKSGEKVSPPRPRTAPEWTT